jgi:hypothetical protein
MFSTIRQRTGPQGGHSNRCGRNLSNKDSIEFAIWGSLQWYILHKQCLGLHGVLKVVSQDQVPWWQVYIPATKEFGRLGVKIFITFIDTS